MYIKKEACDTAVPPDFFLMTGISVVRRLSIPSGFETVLLHIFQVFLLPANGPVLCPAYLSDFRCQSHQQDDACLPINSILDYARKCNKFLQEIRTKVHALLFQIFIRSLPDTSSSALPRRRILSFL